MLPCISNIAQHIHRGDDIRLHSCTYLILEIFIELNSVQCQILRNWTKDSKYSGNMLGQVIVFYWLKG